jgi:hypothetical protein
VNIREPFQPDDLEELHDRLYRQADRVVPMRDIYKGDTNHRVIGLRHDVDDNQHRDSFGTALKLAQWEFDHGYSSTYFLLHGAYYWNADMLTQVGVFEELGHEVGIHVNGIAEALRTGQDPHRIVAKAISELRAEGVRVTGCVAHGDQLCHRVGFVNDEQFTESARPMMGPPDRKLRHNGSYMAIEPVSRTVFGLEYDANWLPRAYYLSDSGGHWSQPFDGVVAKFGEGQLHVLVHPDWWGQAFQPLEVAA